MDPTVKFELKGSVAWVTLNRPEAGNSLNMQAGHDLLDAARRCRGEYGVRAVVVTGAGKAFSFGGDLAAMAMNDGHARERYLQELTTDLHAAIEAFTRLDAPVIVAVNGTAAGGAMGLVAMADLAIAGQGAKFTMAYAGVGLTPDCGTSYFLPRLIGQRRALELALTSRVLTAAEALEWGLVNKVVPDAELHAQAEAMAASLAAGPTKALGQARRLLRADAELDQQLEDESRTIATQSSSAEGQEGIAAFLAKRKPDFNA
jgi:2-(1,2-epoxy-1,2-dihydrophenyl)acetyl-CoA isomerase